MSTHLHRTIDSMRVTVSATLDSTDTDSGVQVTYLLVGRDGGAHCPAAGNEAMSLYFTIHYLSISRRFIQMGVVLDVGVEVACYSRVQSWR